MKRPRPWSEELFAEVVVVGAGAAGLSAALGAAARGVHVLAKAPLGDGAATGWAQGGIAAAVGADDTPTLHAADTLVAGAGICAPEVVAALVEDGPRAIDRLLALGTRFDREAHGELARGREAAHSRRRVLHAAGDATGREILRALVESARREPGVRRFENAAALALARDGERVVGVLARHGDDRLVLHRARAVVLATGGLGQLYRFTTNPPTATGDGLVLAARAGAVLADLEFVQFHPTALASGADPLPLLTEALRGEGAWLVDESGRRFMIAVHPQAELAPRDVVARAIWAQLAAGHQVFLDARAAVGERFPQRFPTVFGICRAVGLDPRREPLPVAPAAHYHMGGVATDERGRTSLPGLWAAGEVACTGVHGANRLASNSLLEALVFGARVAADLANLERRPLVIGSDVVVAAPTATWSISGASTGDLAAPVAELRDLMWSQVGLVRDAAGLDAAGERLCRWISDPASRPELASLATAGWLIAEAARARRESRGAHFRTDYPETAASWARRTFLVAELALGEPRVRWLAPPAGADDERAIPAAMSDRGSLAAP